MVLVITPVEELYAIPAPAESEVEPSLPLKVAKSVEERKPFCASDAWVIESVVPENARGPDTVAVCTPLVPLPTRIPVSDVEPVPPLATVSALVRFSVLIVDEPVTASAVVVAPTNVAPPLKAIWVVVAPAGKGYANVA